MVLLILVKHVVSVHQGNFIPKDTNNECTIKLNTITKVEALQYHLGKSRTLYPTIYDEKSLEVRSQRDKMQ